MRVPARSLNIPAPSRLKIPFSEPSLGAQEARAVLRALRTSRIVGNGVLAKRCQEHLCRLTGAKHALLTPNATQAFELFLHTTSIGPGDEVVIPSFSFVSMANAVVSRGARPVFCDVERETLGLDPQSVAEVLSPRTKLVLAVHYAGQACDMDGLSAVCEPRGVPIFEDAAQGIGATLHGRHLGTLAHAGCLSFHATKNVVAGEGGALLMDDDTLLRKVEIAHEKGTNRSAFLRGEVDKYTWVGTGGSYVLSDLLAALLDAQLSRTDELNKRRREIWNIYQSGTEYLETAGRVSRCKPRADSVHNGHIFWFVANEKEFADRVLRGLKERGIGATFHYQALHASPYAREHLGAAGQSLPVSEHATDALVRLPLSANMNRRKAERVLAALRAVV